jgi:hypothetical protein
VHREPDGAAVLAGPAEDDARGAAAPAGGRAVTVTLTAAAISSIVTAA